MEISFQENINLNHRFKYLWIQNTIFVIEAKIRVMFLYSDAMIRIYKIEK